VILPKFTTEYTKISNQKRIHSESIKNKVKYDLIRYYFNKIRNVDAILVVNETKNGIKNYIGGNSFLEMGFAHVFNKKIFLLNPIPDILYKEELEIMKPIILNGDLNKIAKYI